MDRLEEAKKTDEIIKAWEYILSKGKLGKNTEELILKTIRCLALLSKYRGIDV